MGRGEDGILYILKAKMYLFKAFWCYKNEIQLIFFNIDGGSGGLSVFTWT